MMAAATVQTDPHTPDDPVGRSVGRWYVAIIVDTSIGTHPKRSLFFFLFLFLTVRFCARTHLYLRCGTYEQYRLRTTHSYLLPYSCVCVITLILKQLVFISACVRYGYIKKNLKNVRSLRRSNDGHVLRLSRRPVPVSWTPGTTTTTTTTGDGPCVGQIFVLEKKNKKQK